MLLTSGSEIVGGKRETVAQGNTSLSLSITTRVLLITVYYSQSLVCSNHWHKGVAIQRAHSRGHIILSITIMKNDTAIHIF